ncbi:MAG: DUF1559 domain-containing protein [Armatimonadaceae bacterium]
MIELLTVLAIIALLAAILFPVVHQARRKSHATSCLSNLRQIGMAFAMYAQDYEGKFAYGGDPTDIHSDAWDGINESAELKTIRPLPEVLNPYTKSRELWRCPADTGFTHTGPGESFPLDAFPSSYTRYGMSYYYRTAFALGQHPFGTLMMFDAAPPHQERGPSEIGYLYDGSGKWHGGGFSDQYRYNALHLDGHVKTLNREKYENQWAMHYQRP